MRWIALFRGINVGGKNILPMAKLVEILESVNCKNVSTYIQSGNAVFESASRNAKAFSKRIASAISEEQGFEPDVMLLAVPELIAAIRANPFPKAIGDPKSLHFFFLKVPAKSPDLEAIEKLKAASESYQLVKQVFYLYAPDGIGRSKLAAKVEKCLGVPTTARNYRTVDKLAELAK